MRASPVFFVVLGGMIAATLDIVYAFILVGVPIVLCVRAASTQTARGV